MPGAATTIYCFGRYRLDGARRELSADGAPVALSSRAFDVLQLLIEHRDRVVTKDEIMSVVWRGSIVEDNNLAVQISALRRALAQPAGQPQAIVTVPGRGYRFVAPVEEGAPAEPPASAPDTTGPAPVPTQQEHPTPLRPAARIWPWRAVAGAVLAVLVGIVAYGPIVRLTRPHEPPRLSIVVMPFRNLTGDASQDYLADAVSDDLTTDLSHIPGSLVIARETADVYKGRAVPAGDIGRALNVRYLMEGSLSQGASGVHINAQLIDTATSGHLWADTFDVARDRIGDAQFTIVRHIANALNYTLVDVESERAARERPDSPDAMDLYLQARSVLDRDTSVSGLLAAKTLLERAINIDPDFGDALAELGRTLLRIISVDDPDEVRDFSSAKTLIARSAVLSPRSQRVVLANGYLLSAEENCRAALPRFTLAVQMEPNDVDARAALGECAFRLGEPAAMLAQFQAIERIDPQGGSSGKRLEKQGMCYLFLGQPAEAVVLLDQSLSQAFQMPGRLTQDLGWEEFAYLFDMAAKAEIADIVGATKLYAEYKKNWPNRTVWHMGVYFSRSLQQRPSFAEYEAALEKVGVPKFAAEKQSSTESGGRGDFQTTPLSIKGATVVETHDVAGLIERTPDITIVDVGHGAATIRSAFWIGDEGLLENPLDMVVNRRTRGHVLDTDSPIVVMSDGPFGSASYDLSRQLVSMGFRKVLWYRGGEESWRASNLPHTDRRIQ